MILVAHGQPSDPGAGEAALGEVASGVARHLPGHKVMAATLAAPGALEAALDRIGPDPLIYPMFMTQGWFLTNALKTRLKDRTARVLAPFGEEAGLPSLAAKELAKALRDRGWKVAQTALLVAAHGSGGGREGPARDTRAFAAKLTERLHFESLHIGFIEEAPLLADAARDLPKRSLCLPFFAARGGHVETDIPQALAAAGYGGVLLPPLGTEADAPGMIARSILAATNEGITT